ncbi:unnamed protein product [Cyprideis torosa]|uniref:Uncharacterized protein n=1 Tax=Cyprideis torosa TaxID=163714 RepID=A0A7R8ZTH5_9CRUS|nr:unnamed protein product [Cyprideis torosa]CAG0907585.1 unnamed protein product [Cyprideis torosa]
MQTQLSVAYLLNLLKSRVQLTRIAGLRENPTLIDIQAARSGRAMLPGTLNLIHCNQIQIIGRTENEYLQTLNDAQLSTTQTWLFSCDTRLILFVDDTPIDPEYCRLGKEAGITLVSTPVSHFDVITQVRHIISEQLADRTHQHGVFMEVAGIGVLLAGEPGVGKSELALELICRGHRLIADDAPVFAKTSADTLHGECPSMLRDFLEVRGLGVLNVRQLYGDNAVKPAQTLELIVQLEQCDPNSLDTKDRWPHDAKTRDIMGVAIPETTVQIAPGRNLAILVEAAARNHLLRLHGYDSNKAFQIRLHEHMENQST